MACALCGSDYHNRSACPMSGGLCDNSCMNTKFTCPKCDQDRDQSMRYRDRKHCVVCEGFRLHQRTENPSSFAEFESTFILKRDREARGVKLCPRCDCEKPLTEFKPNGRCAPCYRDERIEQKRRGRKRKADAEGRLFRPGCHGRLYPHDAHVQAQQKHFAAQCKKLAKLMEAATHAPWRGLDANEAFSVRYRLDREYHVRQRMRLQFRKHFVRGAKHVLGIPTPHKRYAYRIDDMLGYTASDLVAHIESLFSDGMTWAAFFEGCIHIDHIIPVVSFDLDDEVQVKACFALSNLRPLWAEDNASKSDRMPDGSRGRDHASTGRFFPSGTQGGVLDAAPFDIWVT